MDTKKSSRKVPRRSKTDPRYEGMTANQVVAYNLTRARQLRGWTQTQATEALEPHLGMRWSGASVSQAERSVAGKFIRNFNADEIVAFAQAFELPVTWFFLPPPPWKDGGPVKLATPDARRHGAELAALIDLVFGDDQQRHLVQERLAEFVDQLGPGRLTASQQEIADTAAARTAAITRHALGDIGQWEQSLRMIADRLAELRNATDTIQQHSAVEAAE